MLYLDRDTLEARLQALPAAPRELGRVRLMVLRLRENERFRPDRVTLDTELGVLGDRWSASEKPKLEAQVTAMRYDVASLLCDGGDPAMLGDNLFLDLDTSSQALPPGTLLEIGEALCEVTPKAHTGCKKFAERVGVEALKLTRDEAWRDQNLRGVHLRVMRGGDVRRGDEVRVLSRPAQ